MEALALRQEAGLVRSDKEFESAVAGGSYLPNLRLMTSSSNKCKSGDFPVNRYALIEGGNYIDLGKEVDVLVLDWHPKALDMSVAGEVTSAYDVDSDLFKSIQAKSELKDSGCAFGPEYLCYIPAVKKYGTFHLNSKSSRREARAMHAQLERAATLKSKLIEGAKHKWQSAVVTACSSEFPIPERQEMLDKIKMFRDSEKQPELAPVDNEAVR
jgi:hypothetical protein